MSTTNHQTKRHTFRMRIEQGRPAAERALMIRARLASSSDVPFQVAGPTGGRRCSEFLRRNL